jgi:hypothetical protein
MKRSLSIVRVLNRTIVELLDSDHDPIAACIVIAMVSAGRAAMEVCFVPHWEPDVFGPTLFLFVLFYTCVYWLYGGLLRLVTGRGIERTGNGILAGFALAWFPTAYEGWFPSPTGTFIFFTDLSWHLFSNSQARGETLALWLMILVTGYSVAISTRSAIRGLIALAGAWLSIQVLSVIVLWAMSVTSSANPGVRSDYVHGALLAMGGTAWVVQRAPWLRASISRLHHALPHIGLAMCGAAWVQRPLSSVMFPALVLGVSIGALLVQNDFFDRKDDAGSGRGSPPGSSEAIWATLFAGLILWASARPSPMISLCGLVLIAAGLLYHYPGLRLKSRFCASYLCEGVGAAAAFAAGAVATHGAVSGYRLQEVVILAVLGGALLSMVKDYKDLDADRAAGMPTYYVVATASGLTVRQAHVRLAVGILVAMAIPLLWVSSNTDSAVMWPLLLVSAITAAALLIPENPRVVTGLAMIAYALFLGVLSFAVQDVREQQPPSALTSGDFRVAPVHAVPVLGAN